MIYEIALEYITQGGGVRERGSAPKRGRHSAIVVCCPPDASVQWQPVIRQSAPKSGLAARLVPNVMTWTLVIEACAQSHPRLRSGQGSLTQVIERGSAPKRGRHYTICVPPSASVQWQPDGLTIHTKKWFLGAGFLRAPPISLNEGLRVVCTRAALNLTLHLLIQHVSTFESVSFEHLNHELLKTDRSQRSRPRSPQKFEIVYPFPLLPPPLGIPPTGNKGCLSSNRGPFISN